jgi:hypothetical protein
MQAGYGPSMDRSYGRAADLTALSGQRIVVDEWPSVQKNGKKRVAAESPAAAGHQEPDKPDASQPCERATSARE